MKILLDTHILIWALTNNPLLPEKAKKIIMDSDNEIYYSITSPNRNEFFVVRCYPLKK